MTVASREQHIQQALAAYEAQKGKKETSRIAFQDGLTLEVIELPLSVPVLNSDSFRIAPDLEDHPKASVVAADPDSDEAQEVIAELVKKSHRKVEGLKDSLINGQHQPGVITRKGKLINANTRCVLLRELFGEGAISTDKIRVAVLPATFTAAEELQLESVLQQQIEHKDEYNFVSELMMLRKLSEEAGLTDAQIARQQERGKQGARLVRDLRAILDLMERGRRLLNPPQPISAFVTEKDQRENWLGILRKVRELDKTDRAAGDRTLAAFMIANYVGLGSVHKGGRLIDENWVAEGLVEELRSNDDDVSRSIVEHIEAEAAKDTSSTEPLPENIELFGDVTEASGSSSPVTTVTLGIVAQAKSAGDGDVELANGKKVPAADIIQRVKATTEQSFLDISRREEAGSRLEKPLNLLDSARKYLRDAHAALVDVVDDDEFADRRDSAADLAEDIELILDNISTLLADDELDDGE